MLHKIFIDGREGTTGLKIDEYLKSRKDIEILHIAPEKRKDLQERIKFAKKADVTFLCLPDIASKELVENLPKKVKIIDASTAHRTNPDWVYGLPELAPNQREKIKATTRIAVPGCHASGFILLVKPLIENGILNRDYPFSCTSITGYSGGGKNMIAEYENQTSKNIALSSPRQYGLMQTHKHLPEMMKITDITEPPIFTPIVANFFNGMLVSIPIKLNLLKKNPNQPNLNEIKEIYKSYYKNQPMIQIVEDAMEIENGFLCANALANRNDVEIFIYGNEDRMILSARYDNLGKGASGAAVQCMNILLGIEETTGLV